MLHVHSVNKSYNTANGLMPILEGVSLELDAGKSVSIQGPSGCGKSTLLHLIGALDKPDAGNIELTSSKGQGIKVHALSETQADEYRRVHVGFVFQRFNLIDCISVLDNISLPSKLNRKFDEPYLKSLLSTLDIGRHVNKFPHQLSGGEQQRVAIARALAHRPSLVLADEPTGNLDEHNSDIVSKLLYRTCKELNTSLVMVTHSAKVAGLADRQMQMQNKRLCSQATSK